MNNAKAARVAATTTWKHFAAFAACLLAFSGPAGAIVAQTNASLLSGLGQSFLDGVAKLNLTTSAGNFGCSGSVLTGGTAILTAAHCVTGPNATATTSKISVSLLGGAVTATSTSYVVNPGWDGDLTPGNDLALIYLSKPITSVAGYSLYFNDAQSATIVLAGYGYTGNGTTGSNNTTFGTLHYGSNQYDGVDPDVHSTYLYDFDNATPGSRNTLGSTGLGAAEAFIASGDSGGPGLIQVNGQWYVAGVHSFDSCSRRTCPIDSSFGEVAGDISVFGQSAWLRSVSAVPEPSAYAMLLAGLGLVAAFAARRQRGPRYPT